MFLLLGWVRHMHHQYTESSLKNYKKNWTERNDYITNNSRSVCALWLVNSAGRISMYGPLTLKVFRIEILDKIFLRLVTSVGQSKNSEFPSGIEPQTFGFRAAMLYHWATETLWWVRPITKFIYDTRPGIFPPPPSTWISYKPRFLSPYRKLRAWAFNPTEKPDPWFTVQTSNPVSKRYVFPTFSFKKFLEQSI